MNKSYLSTINSPQDLKNIPLAELPFVCREIREKIIECVSCTGGHLASSLGAVELIVALHYIYDSPYDKFVWDVGHQAYAHKILTGRKDSFHTLRTYKGISGFPNQNESEHDAFIAGHANTAISAALGMLTAIDKQGKDGKVISVIGDATLTGGMAYEALNNAGHLKKNFLVVLNDNEMAISKNVGGISKYLNKIIAAPFYNRLKKDIEEFIKKIPSIGHNVVKTSHKVEETIKGLIVPGLIFEELGFRYFGPVDGHNVIELIELLKSIKDNQEPIFLHLITKKGKGYKPAEENPEKFHGTVPFDILTGKAKTKNNTVSYTSVFGDAILSMGEKNSKIVAVTAAMCSGTGLTEFGEKYPDRFYDVGIAEQHAVTFAGGMAKEGLRPVVAIYSTFLQRAYDQIIHDVCLQNVPVCFILDRAGLVGADGPTHHGVFDLSYLRCIPNITVAQPKDGNELQSLLKTAISHNGPFAIRFPRRPIPVPLTDTEAELIPIGKGELIKNGTDATIVTIGNHVYTAKEISDELAVKCFNIGVLNARFIKPLDKKLLKSVLHNNKPIITIEDNALSGGFGSAVTEAVHELGYHSVPILRLGLKDEFIPHGDFDSLYSLCGLDKEGIRKSVLDFLQAISSRSFLAYSE